MGASSYAVHFKGRVFKSGISRREALEIVQAFFVNGKYAYVTGPWKRKHR